jgi:16S rRNA G966 N2-methylase RsmD
VGFAGVLVRFQPRLEPGMGVEKVALMVGVEQCESLELAVNVEKARAELTQGCDGDRDSVRMGRASAGLQVINADATSVAWGPTPDLVFVDPPYEHIPEVAPGIFSRLSGLLSDHADLVVVFEMPGGLDLTPPGWTCWKRLGKGARQPTACLFKAG